MPTYRGQRNPVSMQQHPPFFIGICGGSGSGKSELSRALAAALLPGSVTLLALDSYYRRKADFPAAILGNFDHPDSLDASLLAAHLAALHRGETVEMPHYDFTVHDRAAYTHRVAQTPMMILDGILLFDLPAVMAHINLSVFVDTPADVRLARRLQRDIRERGRTLDNVLEQYFSTVRPMHERYVEPHKRHADLVVSGMGGLQEEVDAVLAAIRQAQPNVLYR